MNYSSRCLPIGINRELDSPDSLDRLTPGSAYTSNDGQQDRHSQQLLSNSVPVSEQYPWDQAAFSAAFSQLIIHGIPNRSTSIPNRVARMFPQTASSPYRFPPKRE